MSEPLDSKNELRLEGNKIYLRRHRDTDFPSHQKILNDQETMKHLKSVFKVDVWTDEKVRDRYDKFDADPAALMFSVCLSSDDSVVGGCGFKDLKDKKGEFGLIIDRSVWGSGVAAECHLLCLRYGFENLGLETVYFTTDSWNDRMNGFFKKFKISHTKTMPDGWFCYELGRSQWPEVQKLLQNSIIGSKSSR